MSAAVLSILGPLAAAVLILLTRRRPGPLAVAGAAVGLLGAALALVDDDPLPRSIAMLPGLPALPLRLAIDPLGAVLAVTVAAVGLLVLVYALGYMAEEPDQPRFFAAMSFFVAAMQTLVLAGDWLLFLAAWESIALASYLLIGFWFERPGVPTAATRAFATTRAADLGLYVGVFALTSATGTTEIAATQQLGGTAPAVAGLALLLAAMGKSAQAPLQGWLLDAMAGPTPVSALLHSATLVAAGAYLVIRLAPVLEPVGWFLPVTATLGLLTALAGGVVATLQGHVKRALAASTSAQYGLMLHAVGAGSTVAAAAQLVTHAAFKSLFFLAAGVAIHATGTALLGRLRVGRAYPFVALSAGAGALALAGLPPLGGAWSKEAILAASFDASTGLGVGALAAGLLTALYAARLQLLAFGPGGVHLRVRRPTRPEIAALAVLAGTTIALGVLWLPGVPALLETVVGGELVPARPWEFLAALGVVVTGGLGAAALDRRGRLEDLGLRPGTRDALADWLGLPWLTNALVVAPTIRLSRALARADDRVIDAGVRAAARVAELMSSLVSRRLEISIDGLVTATAAATMRSADASRVADDAGVDAAIEAAGRGVGIAGHQSRRLQTGQSHEYFVIVAAGLVVIAGLLAITR